MRHTKISEKAVREILALAKKAKSIILTSHIFPDTDAVASVVALARILRLKGNKKKIRLVLSGPPLEKKYADLSGFDEIEFVDELADELGDADLVVFLDSNKYSRSSKKPGRLKATLSARRAKTICIDHHHRVTAKDKFGLSLIVPASSTAEIIYRVFCQELKIDRQLAEAVLLGILGDTNNLRYLSPKQLDVFDITKKLLTIADIRMDEFMLRFSSMSLKIFNIVKCFADETGFRRLANWPNFQTSCVRRSLIKKMECADNELDEAAHIYMTLFLRAVTGYKWGFVVYPLEGGSCKVSFRSRAEVVDVRSIAEKMRIGSGHNCAAAGRFEPKDGSEIEPSACINKVISWMKDNKPGN